MKRGVHEKGGGREGKESMIVLVHFQLERYSLLRGSFTLDDFYEVKSMRGVYITTAVDGGECAPCYCTHVCQWSDMLDAVGVCVRVHR